MHELTADSRTLVFSFLESHPNGALWDAFLRWIRQLAARPLDVAVLELPGNVLVSFVPGSDIEVAYTVVEGRAPEIRILRIR